MTTYNKLVNLVKDNFDYSYEPNNTLVVEYDSWKVKIEDYRGKVIMTTYDDNNILDSMNIYFNEYEAYNKLFEVFYTNC